MSTYAATLHGPRSGSHRVSANLHTVKSQMDVTEKRYNSVRPNFRPGPDVQSSIAELRRHFGDVAGNELAFGALADWLKAQGHPSPPSGSTVRRWIVEGKEPDLRSVYIMARETDLTMEEFCGFVPFREGGAQRLPPRATTSGDAGRVAGGGQE